MDPRVTVVVMAYDEAETLAGVCHEIFDSLDRVGVSFEVLVVDDGSTDGTDAVARSVAGERPGVRVVRHDANRGLGAVYRTGFAEARGELLTFFPADGQFPAAILERFVPLMREADVLLGDAVGHGRPLMSRVLSRAERLLYRAFFGRLPRFQGVLMVRRSVVEGLDLLSTGRGGALLFELIVRAVRAGYRVRSVPTELRRRVSGRSKVQDVRTVWSNVRQVLELRRHL